MYLVCIDSFELKNPKEFTFKKGSTYKLEFDSFHCDEHLMFLINGLEISQSILKNYFVNIETWRDLQIKELI